MSDEAKFIERIVFGYGLVWYASFVLIALVSMSFSDITPGWAVSITMPAAAVVSVIPAVLWRRYWDARNNKDTPND